MRYPIIRRKIRITLLVILLAVVFVSVAPLIYESIFIHDEDFFKQDVIFEKYDFSDFFGGVRRGTGISFDATFLKGDYLFSKVRIKEATLKGIAVSADFIIKGRFVKGENDGIVGFSGKLISRDVSLNSEPFLPAKMAFEITGHDLKIGLLRLGSSYELKGRVSLSSPFKTDLRLDVIRADIRKLARLIKAKNPDVAMGIVNGVFYIKGNPANLFSTGILESRNGKIGPVEYDSASIRLEGFGPIINIMDSNIRYGRSNITTHGYVDLRHVFTGGLFDGIRARSDMKHLVWDGWDISKKGKDELSMSKDVGDDVRVGFKTVARDDIPSYNDATEKPEEMSLEYKMGTENLKMKIKENEEFFGIEHSIKF